MSLSVIQNSFLGGEIAPSLYGRLDDAQVAVGAAHLSNFIVQPSGALKKRSGFKFMRSLGSGRFRLIPFRFASDQTLVLIFGNNVMYIAAQGQFVMSGGSPYRVSTPYSESEVWELEYSQNADVVTLTSPNVAPYELRRLGATNWEFKKISTVPDIQPPSNVTAAPTYPATTEESATDDMAMNSEQRDIITAQYVVTAVDADGVESEASGVAITKCNYYITGSTVEVSWSSVAGASTYRVYRYVSGVYGFLAQTSQCSISDTGTNPDTSMTPPTHHEAFIGQASKGEIINISVIDGGSGYSNEESSVQGSTVNFAFMPPAFLRLKWGGGWGFNQYYRLVLISPEGQRYETNVPCSRDNYDSVGESAVFDVWPTAWDGNSCPVTFDQDIPEVTADWYVKLEPSTVPNFEGSVWLEGTTRGWKEQNSFQNRFGDGGTPSGVSATAKTLWKKATTNVMSRFAPMWSSDKGLSCRTALSSMAGNSITLELKVSGGTGARAQATVVNGVIKSVTVLNGGTGYSTNSQVTVVSAQGSGAKFRVEVSGDTPSEFPRASGQFDQRRVFAGSNTNPLKVWMTSSGKQSLMMTHIPIQDDDRIEIVAVASDADMVRHVVGMESLLLFTGSSELRVLSMNSDRLTPSTVGVRAQAYVGSNAVKPVVVGNNVVYIASRGGHPRQIVYSNTAQSYTSVDLGLRCPHFFDNKDVVDMTLSKSPNSCLWLVSNSGELYCSTYLPDQNINAWVHVDVGDKVESVCAIAEGSEDHVYIVVRRNGQACIERMADLTYTNNTNARFVDSYLEASFPTPQTSVSGLNHLEGRDVAVHGDGQYLGVMRVAGGNIVLPTSARTIAVGLPLTARLVSIPFEYGSAPRYFRERNPTRLYMRVTGDGNMEAGIYPRSVSEHLYPVDRSAVEYDFQNQESFVVSTAINGNWDKQSQLEVISNDTLPLEIAAILGEVQFTPSSRIS